MSYTKYSTDNSPIPSCAHDAQTWQYMFTYYTLFFMYCRLESKIFKVNKYCPDRSWSWSINKKCTFSKQISHDKDICCSVKAHTFIKWSMLHNLWLLQRGKFKIDASYPSCMHKTNPIGASILSYWKMKRSWFICVVSSQYVLQIHLHRRSLHWNCYMLYYVLRS